MNSSNVSGLEKAFKKWWGENCFSYQLVSDAWLLKNGFSAAWSLQQSHIDRLEEALRSIAQESYPVGGQPSRRQLSQIKMKCSEALTPESQEGK